MQIPDRIAEAIANNELKASDYYELYGKEQVNEAVKKLQQSNEEILSTYESDKIKASVQNRVNRKNRPLLQIQSNKFKGIVMAAAAVFAFAVILPLTFQKENEIAAPENTIRVKGTKVKKNYSHEEPAINLYRQNGFEIQKLNDGAKAEEGDVIQIAYTAGEKKYGVIFSVDGNGNITRHFPEESWESAKIMQGSTEIPLDFSYELDDAPDFECFVLVTSDKEFNLNNIEKKMKKKTNLSYIKKMSYLPKKTEGITFLLRK